MDPLYKYLPTGTLLTQVAYANFLAQGKDPADFVGCNADGGVIGEEPVPTPEPVAEPEPEPLPEPEPAPDVLPLDVDAYYKRELVALCEHLTIDDEGTKSTLVARINALEEAEVAEALEVLGIQPHD